MDPRDPRLLSEQRRRKILDLIEQKGQITVREISGTFSVSAVTARGDLDIICREGKAVRSHGGAVRKLEGRDLAASSKGAPAVRASLRAPTRSVAAGLNPASRDRTITFILGNRDIVNEFQSKVLLGAEGFLTRHHWALQFMSFRSDLNAPLSSVSLPDVLTQSNRPSGVILTGTHSANILAALSENENSVLTRRKQHRWRLAARTIRLRFHRRCPRISGNHSLSHRSGTPQHLVYREPATSVVRALRRGYRQAMKEADLEPRFSEISSEDRELGYLAVKVSSGTGRAPHRIIRRHGSGRIRRLSGLAGIGNPNSRRYQRRGFQ